MPYETWSVADTLESHTDGEGNNRILLLYKCLKAASVPTGESFGESVSVEFVTS